MRVEIYTADAMLVNMVRQGNIEKWRREEWRRPQDKELKNKELWEQLWEHTQKHTLTFIYTRQHKYSMQMGEWMLDEVEKIKRQAIESLEKEGIEIGEHK